MDENLPLLMKQDPDLAAAALAYVMETAPVLALQLDAQQRVLSANVHARRILGPDLVGRSLMDLMVDFTEAPKPSSDGTQLLSLNTLSGMPDSFLFRRFSLPGGTLALGCLDYHDQERLRTELIGLNGEMNNLSRQLHLANAELSESNHLKNLFLGVAAHDLRSPISVVSSCSEIVLDEAGERLEADHQELLRMCHSASLGMKRLIDNFLDLSVIESGKLRLELAPASAAKILSAAATIGRMVAKNKNVTLLVEPADDARLLLVDISKIQQVLMNLLHNAVEHSTAGKRVWLASRWEDQRLCFSVRDEGPGIALEEQARLFTAFTRASTCKTAGERSVGLGLAIARTVVEAHGGRLWVESIQGQGATFHVSLPVKNPT
jgi:signal transduction histidine kinase